jgi:beta-lactamase regulating signal transducer with metallopeptidase domain
MSALQGLAQLTSSQIVNCLVLGSAVAALAGAASSILGRKSSGVRFVIWFSALVATASPFFVFRPGGEGWAAVRVSLPEISLSPQWALYIFGIWVLFAGMGLTRVARGLVRVRQLKKTCVPLEASHAARIQSSLGSLSRKAQLSTSEHLRVPSALGFFRPVIALPAWTLRELSEEELQTVVLHEAAHLQHWDDWTNLLQKVIRAVLFFHPAVWWIDSRLSIEREMSCDDFVLVKSQSARQYAACLVSLAEKTHAHRSLALVQAAVTQLRHTAERISKILDGKQRTAKPLLKPAVATVMVFGAISLAVVRHTPQLVSFREEVQSSAPSPASNRFDYVANANEPRAQVVRASISIHQTNPEATFPKAKSLAAHRSVATGFRHNVNVAPLRAQPEIARNQPEKRPPAVVNAAMKADVAASFVYLVTQTEQYDSLGNVTVTTSVWRIRVMKPAPAQAVNPLFPHQT